MEAKVRKWGNSLAIRIPRAFAEELELADDTSVELSLEDDALVIHRATESSLRLHDLLAQITDENLHTEIEVSGSVGGEAW
jgi:antitoxin MazE